MEEEQIILTQTFTIFILVVVILGQWLLKDDCECKFKKENKEEAPAPTLTPKYYQEERCTCGTEWDFDGIPSRKSCKKHGIK